MVIPALRIAMVVPRRKEEGRAPMKQWQLHDLRRTEALMSRAKVESDHAERMLAINRSNSFLALENSLNGFAPSVVEKMNQEFFFSPAGLLPINAKVAPR